MKLLLFLLLLPISAFAEGDSDALVAHSEKRKEVCDALTETGTGFFNDLKNGSTIEQLYKSIEIEISDEDYAALFKMIADIADQYDAKNKSESTLHIDLLHQCVTTSGHFDRAFAGLWLEVVPESHPEYGAIQMYVSMSQQEVDQFAATVNQDGNADQLARFNAELLTSIPQLLDVFEHRNQGQLTACGVEFGLTGQDFAYTRGGLVALRGSLMVSCSEKRCRSSFKVRPFDITSLGDQSDSGFKQFDISYTYLKTQAGVAYPDRKTLFKCEISGLCGEFADDYFELVVNAMYEGNFGIVYTRKNGKTDVEIPVVPEKVSNFDSLGINTTNCITELVSANED